MFSIFFFSLFLTATFGDWSEEFDANDYLDSDNKYHLFWSKLNDTHIEIGIECETQGWVGFGISAYGFMTNSDIAFAWIGNNGTVHLQDRYVGNVHEIPKLDSSQDLTLVEGYRINNITSIRFIRAIYPCDANDSRIMDGTTHVIYSWNNNNIPDVDNFDNTVQWHGNNRGSKTIFLLSDTTFSITLENNTQTFDVVMDQYTISNSSTTYYCRLIELPKLNQTNHITKFTPVITSGNEGIVHHMLVYYCPSFLVRSQDIGRSEECAAYLNSSLPSSNCIDGTVIFAWAIGGDEFTFPSDVGVEFSGSSDLQYVILQIHYDNAYQVSGINDSSGIRVSYTSTLRPQNASTLEMGLIVNGYSQFLPPGGTSLVNYGYCSSECTGNGIPETGTNIFASFLHAHTHSVALSLRQIRNGTELKSINSNWNYDFNYQATIAHLDTILLLPNDTLILECYYTTTDVNYTITSGFSTANEMCLAYLYVYPKIPLRTCLSSHFYSDVYSWAVKARDKNYLKNMDTFYYDLTVDGALEWYEALWTNVNYSSRYQLCEADNNTPLLANATINALLTNEYTPYNDTTPCTPSTPSSPVSSGQSYYHYHYLQYIILFIASICAMHI